MQQVFFAGDNVRLAGQLDYPTTAITARGYPIIFIIQHATCTTRAGYAHYARLGTQNGFAVFRWDKRGTGSSGAGGGGSIVLDTLAAYQTALNQPGIDPTRTIILAQNEGSLLLAEAYDRISAHQQPRGIILAGNMLDEKQILKLNVPLHIVASKNDWNPWQTYARQASEAHLRTHGLLSSYYVAPNTNRRLMYSNGGTFHNGAAVSIQEWLVKVCPNSI